MTKIRTRIYSDLDLNFIPHPLTGDIAMKVNEQAISQSLKNIIQYNFFEKPFNPDFRSKVSDLLFEDFSPRIAILIEKYASEIISKYEPRIQILSATVSPNHTDQSYTYILTYRPINSIESVTLNLFLSRVR